MTGEMITVTTEDGSAQAYVARPRPGTVDESHPLPGVLFYIDAIGLRPAIEKMADRIAEWGYIVLAPNVLYRSGTAEETSPDVEFLDDEARGEFFAAAMPRVRALTPQLSARDVGPYLDALHALDGVASGPVGVTGYCMGGRLALQAAALYPDAVAAIGMFHTGGLVTEDPSSPHLQVAEVTASVLAVHADHDRSLPPEAIARFEHALTGAGVTHTASVYPGAAHGYTMSDTSVYNHDASEYHFTELRKLFEQTLH